MSLLLSCIQGYRRDRSFKIPSRTTALGDGDDDGNDDYAVPQQGQGKQEADRNADPAVKIFQPRNTNQEER